MRFCVSDEDNIERTCDSVLSASAITGMKLECEFVARREQESSRAAPVDRPCGSPSGVYPLRRPEATPVPRTPAPAPARLGSLETPSGRRDVELGVPLVACGGGVSFPENIL